MASIQQSLNQLIGSTAGLATAGTYLYSQSPEYKTKQELKDLERQESKLIEASSELGYVAGANTIPEGTPEWRAGEEIAKKRIAVAQRQLELDPTEERAKNLGQARSWYEIDYPKAQAEQKAVQRITAKTDTQRQMLQGLVERFDTLSAKQKRQVLDVAHKSAKKGGMNE